MINKRMLLKFVISYITILIIPIIIFTIVVKTYTVKQYEEKLINNNYQVVENVTNNLGSQISSLMDLSNQLRVDDDFSSYMLEKKRVTYIDIEEKVMQYSVLNDFAHELYFSSNTTAFLYGTQTHAIGRYCNELLINPSFTSHDYRTLFTSASIPTWVPMNNVSLNGIDMDITTLVIPVERSMIKNTTKSTMIFHITKNNIEQIIAPLLQDSSSFITVSMNDVNIYNNSDQFFNGLLEDHSRSKEDQPTFLIESIDGSDYYVISSVNDAAGITLTQYIDIVKFKEGSQGLLFVAYAALLSSAVLGLLFILIALKITYQPIKRLSDYAKALSSTNYDDLGEVASTRQALDELQSRNRVFSMLNTQYKRERTILKLASNTAGDRDTLLKECIDANIDTFCNYYICISIDLDFSINDTTHFEKEAFIAFVDQHPGLYFSEISSHNNLILILGSEFDDYIYVNNLLDELIPAFFVTNNLTIGVGDFTDSIYTMNPSYCQSLISLNRASNSGETIGHFRQFKDMGNKSTTYDRKDLRNLFNAISALDKNKIRSKSQRLKKSLRTFPEADYVWIYIAHDIVNTAIQALDTQDIGVDDLFNKYTYTLHSTDFSNPEQVNAVIDELISDVLKLIDVVDITETATERKNLLDITEIHEFILKNYKEPNISVKSIAQDFNTSMSNLSHFFKSKMGKNISAYINELRINEAKKLLSDTSMTISEIVEIIGGNYASSFIRNFKKSTGMTPGDYRENNTNFID